MPASGRRAHEVGPAMDRMQDLAKSRGGRCISTVYPVAHGKLNLECGKCHMWKATVNSVWRG